MTKKLLNSDQNLAGNLLISFFITLFVALMATVVLLFETLEIPSRNDDIVREKSSISE